MLPRLVGRGFAALGLVFFTIGHWYSPLPMIAINKIVPMCLTLVFVTIKCKLDALSSEHPLAPTSKYSVICHSANPLAADVS